MQQRRSFAIRDNSAIETFLDSAGRRLELVAFSKTLPIRSHPRDATVSGSSSSNSRISIAFSSAVAMERILLSFITQFPLDRCFHFTTLRDKSVSPFMQASNDAVRTLAGATVGA